MRKRVLVVEDDAEMVDLLRFNLQKAGFAIATAADGIEALKKVRSLAPDLIVLDLMLPELDGFSVCEILRQDPDTASTPIIMLTAKAQEADKVVGFDLGAVQPGIKAVDLLFIANVLQQPMVRHHEMADFMRDGEALA